jgi:hypothetical protein
MDSITIPVRAPLTFDRLLELNPHASAGELAETFPHLPAELRTQAWEDAQAHIALGAWDERVATS